MKSYERCAKEALRHVGATDKARWSTFVIVIDDGCETFLFTILDKDQVKLVVVHLVDDLFHTRVVGINETPEQWMSGRFEMYDEMNLERKMTDMPYPEEM